MRASGLLISLLFAISGCKAGGATATPAAEEAATAVDVEEHAFYDGEGRGASLAEFVASVADTDLVGFGELHHHPVGSRVELELLQAMAGQERPVALAMEFFEADTQGALDDYLAGRIDEAEFRQRSGRDESYDASHRPLIELCKEAGIPVIAANAPRPLVTAYRKSKLDYPGYLATLTEEERALLPRSSVPPDDEFKRRFMALMGPKRGPSFYRSMALWNDAMAESIADFRASHSDHRVLLIVGEFHVAAHLGTMKEFVARRPEDSTKVLSMKMVESSAMAFAEDFHGEGDLILAVRPPPAK